MGGFSVGQFVYAPFNQSGNITKIEEVSGQCRVYLDTCNSYFLVGELSTQKQSKFFNLFGRK